MNDIVGAVQFGGAGSWNTTLSLQIEKHAYLKRIQHLREQLNQEPDHTVVPICTQSSNVCLSKRIWRIVINSTNKNRKDKRTNWATCTITTSS